MARKHWREVKVKIQVVGWYRHDNSKYPLPESHDIMSTCKDTQYTSQVKNMMGCNPVCNLIRMAYGLDIPEHIMGIGSRVLNKKRRLFDKQFVCTDKLWDVWDPNEIREYQEVEKDSFQADGQAEPSSYPILEIVVDASKMDPQRYDKLKSSARPSSEVDPEMRNIYIIGEIGPDGAFHATPAQEPTD